MKLVILCILAGLSLSQSACPPQSGSQTNAIVKRPTVSGKRDAYIAALFGLHAAGDKMGCGAIQYTSVQNLMAFMYALQTAGSKVSGANSLFGLGGIVFDTCKTNANAIQKVMNFEECLVGYGEPPVSPSHTFGYVGPETVWVSDLLPVTAAFHKTQIAFSSTHPMFSDHQAYPYMLRTIPSDKYHINAIVHVLKKMNYKAVQFVYVDSGMGRSAKSLFEAATSAAGICVEQFVDVPENVNKTAEYDEAVDHLVQQPTVKTVVLWFDRKLNDQDKSQAHAFLEAVLRRNARGMFYWVSTDAWAMDMDLTGLKQTAEGAVLVVPTSSNTQFETYFRNLKPTGQPQVFQDWWMDKFNCDLPGSSRHPSVCDLNSQTLSDELINPRAGFIIDAVHAIADGIRAASALKCFGKEPICDDFLNSPDHLYIVRDDIMKAMEGKLFNNVTGDPRQAKYKIYNYRRPVNNQPEHHYSDVGTFTQLDMGEPILNLDAANVHIFDSRGVRVAVPQSMCPAGSCVKCAPPTAPPVTTTVVPVVETTRPPSPQKTGPYEMVRMKTWMFPLMVLAGLGLFITICFEIYILSKLIGTKTVKHFRTMWLGQLLLVGIFLSYLLLFAFVPSPTTFTCGLIRFGVGTCYAIMYSVLLVKLMIILSSESIGYLKGVYQVLMFIFALAVQVVIDAEWLVLVPPSSVWNEEKMDWQCTDQYLDHIQSLVYVMFLIFICTVIAARTHGIITNHREGIFIGLAAGFSIPIWIAWTLVGSLNENTDFQEPTVAYGLLINATLILFTMFLPKVRQLNTMGMEGIYLEDDGNDNDAYGSVIYGPPSYQSRPASVYQANGAPLLTKDGNGQAVQLIPQQQILYDQLQHPGYLRSTAGSVRSVPAYNRSKTLKVTGDLTGRPPFDKRAVSEIAYKNKPSSVHQGTLKRSGSATDLGAL